MQLKRLRVDVLQNFSPIEKATACKNLGLDKVVRTINGTPPDANGDIVLNGDGSTAPSLIAVAQDGTPYLTGA